jgi:hypothetical protein
LMVVFVSREVSSGGCGAGVGNSCAGQGNWRVHREIQAMDLIQIRSGKQMVKKSSFSQVLCFVRKCGKIHDTKFKP